MTCRGGRKGRRVSVGPKGEEGEGGRGRTHPVGREQAHLDELDDVLARGLREHVRAEAAVVPDAGPPRAVDLVVLELAREEERDEELVEEALDEARRDDAEDGVAGLPDLEEPEQLEEADQADDREAVRDRGHRRAELAAAVVEHRAEEERDEEQDEQDDHVEDDRPERDDGDADEARHLLDAGGGESAGRGGQGGRVSGWESAGGGIGERDDTHDLTNRYGIVMMTAMHSGPSSSE